MNRRALIASLFIAPIAPKLARIISPLPKYFEWRFPNGGTIKFIQGTWNQPARKQAYKEIQELINIIKKAK